MRALFVGRKPVGAQALAYLLDRGAEVVGVVTDGRDGERPQGDVVIDLAAERGVPIVTHDWLHARSMGDDLPGPDIRDIDLLLCMFHQRRIRGHVLKLARLGSVNIHPAPLPAYRGWGVYNVGILENAPQWGATAHIMDEAFDAGPIVRQRLFDVDMRLETCLSLERRTQGVIAELAREVIDLALTGEPLARTPQGEGRTFTKKDFLRLRKIVPEDDAEMVDRKIRAFWYPPYVGAEVEVGGRMYTLVSEEIMASLGRALFGGSQDGVRAWWVGE